MFSFFQEDKLLIKYFEVVFVFKSESHQVSFYLGSMHVSNIPSK